MEKEDFIKVLRKLVSLYGEQNLFKPKELQTLLDLIITIENGKEEEWKLVNQD